MTLKSASFTDLESTQFASMLASDALDRAQVRTLRGTATSCPAPVPETTMREYVAASPAFLPDSAHFEELSRTVAHF
eukprot:2700075-Amphidinium_carterae.1